MRSGDSKQGQAGNVIDAELAVLAREIDARCRLHGSFVLRSGQVASEYFDKYLFEADPRLLHRVAERMVPLVPEGAQLLAGLELGGVPIATMLSQLTGLPALFVRKHAKEYGTRKLIEGADPAGQHVVLLEDVITTGGAVLMAATALRDLSATVSTAICAIDRTAPGVSLLAEHGISVRSALTKADLDAAASSAN